MSYKIKKSVHVLAVHDFGKSWDFYTEVLGFTPVFREGNLIGMVRNGGMEIFLGESKESMDPHKLGDHRPFARINVDGIDALHEEIASKYNNLSAPESKPWGMREFAVETPDGHQMTFYQELA